MLKILGEHVAFCLFSEQIGAKLCVRANNLTDQAIFVGSVVDQHGQLVVQRHENGLQFISFVRDRK